MMELVMWIIVYMGQALAALVIIVLWALLIFVIVDEIIGLFRPNDTSKKDGDTT